LDQSIFVWLHRLDHSRACLKTHIDANHFSISEPCFDEIMVDQNDVFVFQDFAREKAPISSPSVLSLPDSVTGDSRSVVMTTNHIGCPSVPSFQDLVTGDSSSVVVAAPNSNSMLVVTKIHKGSPSVLSVLNSVSDDSKSPTGDSNSVVVAKTHKHKQMIPVGKEVGRKVAMDKSSIGKKLDTNQLPGFQHVQNGIYMEYSNPKMDFCEEFLHILRELPSKIQSNLSHDCLCDILHKEEMRTTTIQDMLLVFIASCKFEFFLSNDLGSIRLFDELIMTPYLKQWSARKFMEIKTTGDFYDKLLEYNKIFFPQKDIHAVSFLLHFPGISKERQWSHVDGTRIMLQGSIMCGDWQASTLEFSVLAPIVSKKNYETTI
jgi:hypothetical protein